MTSKFNKEKIQIIQSLEEIQKGLVERQKY